MADEKQIVDEKAIAVMGDTGSDTKRDLEQTVNSPHVEAFLAMTPEERAEVEKKLLRKMDFRLIPWMTLLYLMSFLDRVNVGTANLWGLSTDLKLDSQMFTNASLIFFVSYVAFEVPSNLVLKRLRPSIYIPGTMVAWALFQIFMGLVKNYGQLLALRFCLGIFEAGLFPGLNFYLNGWYRRDELSKRTAIFFAGAVLAGAFGGIFGYALGKMDGIGGKAGWSWIFIMEGILTLVVALCSFGMIHDWPDRAKFLTEFERDLVLYRLRTDTGLAQGGQFSWKTVNSAFKDWRTYLFMLCYIGPAQCIYSQSLFSPTIIASLGAWSKPQSLLMSTPPYVVAFITTLLTAWFSDKYMIRGPLNMFWAVLAAIGYIILLCLNPLKNVGAAYFAVFLTTMSIAPMISTTIVWCGNNFGSHYRKATIMGLVFTCGNSGGIWASLAYRTKDKPRYFSGHGCALAFACLNLITSIILYIGMRKMNRDREAKYGPAPGPHEVHDVDDPEYRRKWGLENMSREEILNLGDQHPGFRFIL